MLTSYNNCPGAFSRAAGVRFRTALMLPLLAISLAACDTDKLLDVEDNDVATPVSLENRGALSVLHAAGIGDFQVAYTGSNAAEGQINLSGIFTDEFLFAETFPTRLEVDMRSIQEQNATTSGLMRDIQRARGSSDFSSAKFATLAPADVRRAELMNLAGFAIVIMGENYCSGVPISSLTDAGELVFGQPRTTAQLWDDAQAKFDSAIVIAGAAGASGATQLNLARVGRGRALLNKGDFNGAAAAVAGVASSFNYLIFNSVGTARQNNGVWVFQRLGNRWTVADREGINGLPYISDRDPRTPTTPAPPPGLGFDGSTPLIFQNKYPLRDSDVPLANGVEARLIEAEAALRAGNVAGFTTGLNAARSAQGQAAIVAAGTPDARRDQLFKERAYSLWLTSHRLGDLRRLIRQYSRTQDQVFPTGPYPKGGSYGTDVNIIIPFDEKNNPNF
ncbi:MAG TPA: hypothetical protein VNJ04_06715, partial [Gemmatimonadaceae bacterium]|nr:hypothetical protein [Gemmatimonadaceae bacterium]